jgi:DNA-binding XRE family transcriptional regulator
MTTQTIESESGLLPQLPANSQITKKSPTLPESDFEKLLDALENSKDGAAELSEARKWLADAFYPEQLTIASLRLKAGLSQQQLGELCGIKQSHVSRYESGKHEPSISLAINFAKALNVSAETIFLAWCNSRQTHHPSVKQN